MKKTLRKFKETLEIRSSFWQRLRNHRLLPVTLLVCAFLVAACFHIWQRVKVIQLAKSVSRLRVDNAFLVNESRKIHSEIAALKMSSRIEQYASDSLGLQSISTERLFTLVKKEAEASQSDDLDLMATALNRMARHLPVVSENEVYAGQQRTAGFDTALSRENGQ